MIYLPIILVHWSSSSPSVIFFLWFVAAVSLHGMPCAMSPWAHQDCLVIHHWWWSVRHLCVYHVQIWASLSLDDSTLINILQKSSIFTLEQIWPFLLSSSSLSLRQTPSTWHLLLHLEHSSLEQTLSALIPFVVNVIDILWYNCCMHNPGYHTYYDTNSWEIRRFPLTTLSTPWDQLSRAYKMNIKRLRRTIHNLTWFGPNLAYVHEERIWESFINKLDTKRSNLPLDDTRVFTFPLNVCPIYKSIPSLYAPSLYSSLS